MDKTAQKRNLLNKLYELGNVSAWSAENFFAPELKKIMNRLVEADDVVRSALAGEKVGKGAPADPVSAKQLLKDAKQDISRREYLSAVASLSRFHKKMQEVSKVIHELDLNVSNIHHQFLFNQLPNKHREQLEDFEKRTAAADTLDDLTKRGGLIDFFHNIGTQRGRALAAWEKRYPEVVGKVKQGAINQLEASQRLLDEVLTHLKTLASLRAGRKIAKYLEVAKQVETAFTAFDTGKDGFRVFYNSTIKPYMDAQRQIEKDEEARKAKEMTAGTPPAVVTPGADGVPGEVLAPSGAPTGVPPMPGGAVPGIAPGTEFGRIDLPAHAPTPLPPPPRTPSNVEPEFHQTTQNPPGMPTNPPASSPDRFKSDEVAEELFGRPRVSSYQAFLESLEVFGQENPDLLAAHIAKYARSIQEEQPDTAIQLFKIAKSLRG